jgi:hypothetical protein
MGCGASAGRAGPGSPEAVAAAVEAREQAARAQAAAAAAQDDDATVLGQFRELLAGLSLGLGAEVMDAAYEERTYTEQCGGEYRRARTALNRALGGLTALETTERDRQERRNRKAEDGGREPVTSWRCRVCTASNPVERPVCATCARVRFQDGGVSGGSGAQDGARRTAVVHAVAVREAELRAAAYEAMARMAATAPVAKRLTAARRRQRAVRAGLALLGELGNVVRPPFLLLPCSEPAPARRSPLSRR